MKLLFWSGVSQHYEMDFMASIAAQAGITAQLGTAMRHSASFGNSGNTPPAQRRPKSTAGTTKSD